MDCVMRNNQEVTRPATKAFRAGGERMHKWQLLTQEIITYLR